MLVDLLRGLFEFVFIDVLFIFLRFIFFVLKIFFVLYSDVVVFVKL